MADALIDNDAYLDYLTHLRTSLSELFGDDDLRTLCFDLGVDYENIEGDTKQGKCREIVQHFKRQHEINKLEQYCKKHRPNAIWKFLSFLQHQKNNSITSSSTESEFFSGQIREQFALSGKVIEELTANQFQIIQWLHGHRRASISGCAGSGKTLVACEKAIRLGKAGLRVLFLTHNPYLANYVKGLVHQTSVHIFDFVNWVNSLSGDEPNDSSLTWSHFDEPSDSQLEVAFDKSVNASQKYDAVIVDEGQDFRETWWILVESALNNPESGTLYIFHDDNQTLLPKKSKYPILEAPYLLSRNCRNTGKIFDLVRVFHPQAPDKSISLSEHGFVKLITFESSNELSALTEAIQDAILKISPDHLVVLTTESDPLSQSVASGLRVAETPPWSWQEAIKIYLGEDLSLSNSPVPTREDVVTVSRYAQSLLDAAKATPSPGWSYNWRVVDHKLVLIANPRHGFNILWYAGFFVRENWAIEIPQPMSFDVLHKQHQDYGRNAIPLHSIASYKGLESDGVILFVRSSRDSLNANLYVGCSRARFLLYVVIDHKTFSRCPLFDMREKILVINASSSSQKKKRESKSHRPKILSTLGNTVSVSLSSLADKNVADCVFTYTQFPTITDFLDTVWLFLKPYGVPHMQYGQTWIIRNKITGKEFREMGRQWVNSNFGDLTDKRGLAEVGIQAGMQLEVILIS